MYRIHEKSTQFLAKQIIKKDENYQLINICPLHCQKVFHSFSSAVLLSSFYCALTALLLHTFPLCISFKIRSKTKEIDSVYHSPVENVYAK